MLVNTNVISPEVLAKKPEEVYTKDYLYPPPTANELSSLTCQQLRDCLKGLNLPTSGKKEELIQRLLQSEDIPDTFHEIDHMFSTGTATVTLSKSPLKSVQVSTIKSPDAAVVVETGAAAVKSPASLAAVETAELKSPPFAVAVDAAKLKSPFPVVVVETGAAAAADTAAANAAAIADAAAGDAAAAAGTELKTSETSAAAVVVPNATSLKRSQPDVVEITSATSSEKKMKATTGTSSPKVHALHKCDLETYHGNGNQRASCGEGQLCVNLHQLAAEPGALPDFIALTFHNKDGQQGFVGPIITGMRESPDFFPGCIVGYMRMADDPNKVMGDGTNNNWRPTYVVMCHLHHMTPEQFHQDIVNRCNAYANSHIGEGHGNFMYPVEFIKGDLHKTPVFWNDLLNSKSVMLFLKQYYKKNTLQDIIADESVMIRFFGSVEVGRERLNSKKAQWDKL